MSRSRRSFLGAALCALTLSTLPSLGVAQSLPPGLWDMLGERRVNLRAERDVIVVGAREGTYRAVMIDVLGRTPIELRSCVLVFENGERRELSLGEVVRPRGRSRVIDLPGGVRFIRRIELVYRADGGPRRGRGHVRVFGMR